jgi:hypothetical protein
MIEGGRKSPEPPPLPPAPPGLRAVAFGLGLDWERRGISSHQGRLARRQGEIVLSPRSPSCVRSNRPVCRGEEPRPCRCDAGRLDPPDGVDRFRHERSLVRILVIVIVAQAGAEGGVMLVEAGRCGSALTLALAQVAENSAQLPRQVRNGRVVDQLTIHDLSLQLLTDHGKRGRLPDHDFVGRGLDLELDQETAKDVTQSPCNDASAVDAVEQLLAIRCPASRLRLSGV